MLRGQEILEKNCQFSCSILGSVSEDFAIVKSFNSVTFNVTEIDHYSCD